LRQEVDGLRNMLQYAQQVVRRAVLEDGSAFPSHNGLGSSAEKCLELRLRQPEFLPDADNLLWRQQALLDADRVRRPPLKLIGFVG
jgi:hypothetical protein